MPQSMISLIQAISEPINIFSFVVFCYYSLSAKNDKAGKGNPNNCSVKPTVPSRRQEKKGQAGSGMGREGQSQTGQKREKDQRKDQWGKGEAPRGGTWRGVLLPVTSPGSSKAPAESVGTGTRHSKSSVKSSSALQGNPFKGISSRDRSPWANTDVTWVANWPCKRGKTWS